ncbi:hypothetical protein D3C72_1967980 [compost metagenome]
MYPLGQSTISRPQPARTVDYPLHASRLQPGNHASEGLSRIEGDFLDHHRPDRSVDQDLLDHCFASVRRRGQDRYLIIAVQVGEGIDGPPLRACVESPLALSPVPCSRQRVHTVQHDLRR